MAEKRGVAILVGAGDAIGAAVARRFAEGGYAVCICRRDAAKSQALIDELKNAGLEAHAFSDAIGDFKKAGAQVIGMSADNLATLKDFSVKECRNAFPVATATPTTQKAYDVAWAAHPGLTTRTSYVIDRRGRIVMVHDDLDFSQHVAKTLAAVKALK